MKNRQNHPILFAVIRSVYSFGLFVTIFSSLALSFVFVLPVSAEIGSSDPAQSNFQLVPCDPTRADQPCNYQTFIIGIQRIIKACILFAVPLAAGVFGWFGFKMMTAGGDTKVRGEAKEAMFKVLKGMLLMLAAWYIVDLALDGLLDSTFTSGLQ
ncbi:MAG: hypothetical protein AAB447_04060 [Patescibacteria group bacterium]